MLKLTKEKIKTETIILSLNIVASISIYLLNFKKIRRIINLFLLLVANLSFAERDGLFLFISFIEGFIAFYCNFQIKRIIINLFW